MKNKKLALLISFIPVKIFVLASIIIICYISIVSSHKKPKIENNIYNLKMIRKWEIQGIHCYAFIMDNDTIIAYSESDINRQQR